MSELEHGKQTYQQTLQNILPANTTNPLDSDLAGQILASTGVYSRKPPHVEEERFATSACVKQPRLGTSGCSWCGVQFSTKG